MRDQTHTMTRQLDSRITTGKKKKGPEWLGFHLRLLASHGFVPRPSTQGHLEKVKYVSRTNQVRCLLLLSLLPALPRREPTDGGVGGSPFFHLKFSVSYPTSHGVCLPCGGRGLDIFLVCSQWDDLVYFHSHVL